MTWVYSLFSMRITTMCAAGLELAERAVSDRGGPAAARAEANADSTKDRAIDSACAGRACIGARLTHPCRKGGPMDPVGPLGRAGATDRSAQTAGPAIRRTVAVWEPLWSTHVTRIWSPGSCRWMAVPSVSADETRC